MSIFVCPDCHCPFDVATQTSCFGCGWQLKSVGNIPMFWSSNDRKDPIFSSYFDNYESIAVDDVKSNVVHNSYTEIQASKLLGYLGDIRGKRVCEVGIGQGVLLDKLIAASPEVVVGVDISSTYLKKFAGRPGTVMISANAENLPLKPRMDALIASDIVEHVLNVGDFLLSINRALVADGKLVVRVPNEESLMAYAQQMGCHYKFVHLRSFSKSSLKRMLEQAGFEVERFEYDGYAPSRARSFIRSRPFFLRRFNRYIEKNFKSSVDVNRISNRLGNALMQPYEIVAIAKKKRHFFGRLSPIDNSVP